ncbi:MAG: Vms1/Ankzf1 family peptidyl-tRNA hydrolase [Halarchaeum sp.]
MLDRLLGRAALKERIDELEDEVESLERQRDAESERRRDAVAARNDAEETVNRLEDRITELEDRVERAEADGERALDYRARADLHGGRLDRVLSRLETVECGTEGALSAMVPDDHDVPDAVVSALGERAALVERAAPCLVYADDESLVTCALSPPLAPDAFCAWEDAFRVEREWFEPTGTYALALVRADVFAVGIYDATGSDVERVRYEGFESDVKGTHSKGGFSQSRFERRRESQIDEHLDDARAVLDGVDYDALYVTGEETVFGAFDDADATRVADASGPPREALERAHETFWTTPYRSL